MEPLVSIGVPVYNGEDYLEECLASIYNQTYKNWECFIINNQSTDKSPLIGEKFVKLDKRFILITNETFVEMIENFNNSVKYISEDTKYFKAVCADDWLYPDCILKMVALMEAYPKAGIGLAFRLDNLKVGCTGLDYKEGPFFEGKETLQRELKGTLNITGSETNQLFRVDTLKQIRNFPIIFSNESYNFDTSLAYDLLDNSDLVFAFEVLSYTRRHEATYTSKYKDRFRTTLNAREYELYRFKKQFPELESNYKGIRHRYGMVYLKRKLSRDADFINWHHKWLHPDRRFTAAEFIQIIFKSMLGKLAFVKNGKSK